MTFNSPSSSNSVPWWVNSDKGTSLHWRSCGSLSSAPFSGRTPAAGHAAAWRWLAARGQTGSQRSPDPLQTRLPPEYDQGGEAGRGDPHWEERRRWCSQVLWHSLFVFRHFFGCENRMSRLSAGWPGYAVLSVSRYAQVLRAVPCSDDQGLCRHAPLAPIRVHHLIKQ